MRRELRADGLVGNLFCHAEGQRCRFVSYVPDNVLTPLIKGVTSDNYFISVNATREDEAIGMVAGAWMAGMKGVVMMQTSGFAVAPNALASLIVPYQIPAILVVSERGVFGEFNIGQHMVASVAADARYARHRAPHARRREHAGLHGRHFDQAGGHDAGAGRLHPFAAC